MTQLAFAAIPGGPKTYASHRVWKGSVREAVTFVPLSRKEATRRYHDARRFERQTRKPGRQDGAIGRNGLAILHALVFDFLNHRTGQLDPCYETIAHAANISIRSVARGLVALKKAGVLFWVKRCEENLKVGTRASQAYELEQTSNAYAVLPPSNWVGYRPPAEPPPPDPSSLGAHPPDRHGLDAVAEMMGDGVKGEPIQRELEKDDTPLGKALARLGRLMRP